MDRSSIAALLPKLPSPLSDLKVESGTLTTAAAGSLLLYLLVRGYQSYRRFQISPLPGNISPETAVSRDCQDNYLGLVPVMAKEPLEAYSSLLKVIQRAGSPSAGNMMDRIFYFFGTPEHVKEVLNNPDCREKDYKSLGEFLGKSNLVGSPYATWKPMRRTLAPIFHLSNMRLFFDEIVQAANEMVAKIKSENSDFERAFEERKSQGKIFERVTSRSYLDVDKLAGFLALDIITRTLFSMDNKTQEKEGDPLTNDISYAMTEYSHSTRNPFFAYLHPIRYFNYRRTVSRLHGYFRKLVLDRKAQNSAQPKEGKKDLLDLMLEAKDPDTGNELSVDQLVHQCFTFYFAGHDTTAHTIAWALWEIAHHPEVEELIHQEIEEVLGERDAPTYDDLGKLTYINWVIKETLRLHSPAPQVARVVTGDKTTIGGVRVPKKSVVLLDFTACHFNEEVWENPERFDPSRFEESRAATRHSHAWAPFSMGERNCIGMNFALVELKVVLAAVCKQFYVKPSLDRFPHLESKITSAPAKGVFVSFVPRE